MYLFVCCLFVCCLFVCMFVCVFVCLFAGSFVYTSNEIRTKVGNRGGNYLTPVERVREYVSACVCA